jgi:hypothetical protein
MDEITCAGRDGAVFHYHAVQRADLDRPFVSWVLVLEGSDPPLDPQRVTAAEVLGDLVSMEIRPDDAFAMVETNSERMLQFAREQRDGTSEDRRGDWQEIVSRLTAEIEELRRAAGSLTRP